MSRFERTSNVTVRHIAGRKGGDPVVCLTAYTARMAEILDPHCDLLLVGDSVGSVIHGQPFTVGVTLDMMILHGQAVMRGAPKACVIVDMPFGSYEESKEQAFRNCAQVMQETGCSGIKLEGGVEMAPTIEFLVSRGIPVMGHIGLQPQSVNVSGYAAKGTTHDEWATIIEDAKAVEAAGAFAVVLEAVAGELANKITAETGIVTIGIGASAQCDGQILVTEDLLGLFERTPSFVKRYAEMGELIESAVKDYADDVKTRRYPGKDHTYGMKD